MAELKPTDEGVVTKTDLSEWLSKWNLSGFTEQLKKHGISSPNDFEYIESVTQFQELSSSLYNINFMQKCKLMKAWKSIVPNPEKPPTQIHFLGDKEKHILNTLNERFAQLTKDIEYVKKSFNAFNESIVSAKQSVNQSSDKLILIINKKRKELLTGIGSIKDKNVKVFNDKLNTLDKMNKLIKNNKETFIKIGSNDNITSTERLKQLQKLLVMNIDVNDDEKKHDDNTYFKSIGDQCIIPNKISFVFDEQSFTNNLNSNITVNCDNINTKWNMNFKLDKSSKDCDNKRFIFDVYNNAYFDISENGTVITSKLHCAYTLISTKTPFNQGILQWKIKIIERKDPSHWWNPSIGIVTDVSNAKQAGGGNTSSGFKCFRYAYLWDSENGILQSYHNGTATYSHGNGLKFVEDDVITVTLNCNEWTLSFSKNDEAVGTLNLQKNEIYHPMIYSCGCKNQKYELLID